MGVKDASEWPEVRTLVEDGELGALRLVLQEITDGVVSAEVGVDLGLSEAQELVNTVAGKLAVLKIASEARAK